MGHKVKQSLINSRIDFFYHAFRNVLLVSVPLLILSALILGLSTSHGSAVGSGSSGTDNIQLVLSTSCTVNAVVTSEHTVSLNGGQLGNNVGNTKLSAYCNDNNGYSIYAIGSSNNIDGNTDLVNTINESYNIRTGVYDSNNVANPSSWAMKLTAGTGTGIDPVTGESVPTTPPTIVNGYDNYSAIPNVYTQVAKRTSGTSMTTDTSVSGSYLNTTYQIYANSAQPAGTYNGKVKYVIIHPSSSNNTISDIDAAFAAVGKQKAYQDADGNYYYAMQDMNPIICASVDRTGEITTTQLVDKRDNNLYYVTKEKDGNCWMTQNLALNLDKTVALTSENTDLNHINNPSANDYPEYGDTGYVNDNGIIKWTPSASTVNSAANWSNNMNYPRSLTSSGGYTDQTKGRHGLTGNYYNWSAAIASNDSRGISADNIAGENREATNSVCPKGWRLPQIRNYVTYNTGDNDFNNLNLYYNGSKTNTDAGLLAAPLYFMRSGYVYYTSIVNFGGYGGYRSSTVNNTNSAYYLNFRSVDVSPASGNSREFGLSVRCIAR